MVLMILLHDNLKRGQFYSMQLYMINCVFIVAFEWLCVQNIKKNVFPFLSVTNITFYMERIHSGLERYNISLAV